MKKLFHLLLCVPFLVACSSEEPLPKIQGTPSYDSSEISTAKRSVEEAINIASNAACLLDSENKTILSRGTNRDIERINGIYVVENLSSRAQNSDTLLYVINYAYDQGFAIVPTSRNFPDVLAITEKGNFNPAEATPIQGFNDWYSDIVETLSFSDITDIDTLGIYTRIPLPGEKYNTIADTIWSYNTRAQLKIAWGQDGDYFGSTDSPCEGNFCPNYVAGCVNIAAAMAMSFTQPEQIQLTYKNEKPILDLNWNELTKYCAVTGYEFTYNPISSYNIRETISHLCKEIGYRAHTNYGYNQSDVSGRDALSMLKSISLINNSTEYTNGTDYFNYVKGGNAIAFILGTDPARNNAGHAWLCDGALQYKVQFKHYSSTDYGKTWKYDYTTMSQEQKFVHYNWGWYGYCNGYYVEGDFMPRHKHATTSDKKNYNGSHQYVIIRK